MIRNRTARHPVITLSDYLVYATGDETPEDYRSLITSVLQSEHGASVDPSKVEISGKIDHEHPGSYDVLFSLYERRRSGELRHSDRRRGVKGAAMKEQKTTKWSNFNPLCLARHVLRNLWMTVLAGLICVMAVYLLQTLVSKAEL